ncbi:MAG: AAC(3) family N-acetyltransferase [Lachnospiraceae bacterium]
MEMRYVKIRMKKNEFVKELKNIGIQEGMELEVHSSLSSFGYVEGGAETVIEALMECVGENGSIFMPALRLGPAMELTEEDKKMGITVKIKVLPEDAPKTDMGIIADTFRRRADVITSEGIIRTSGWGLHAKEVVKGGLDYVIHNGGKALLLGVDIYKLTAMHYMEDILPQEISDIFAPNEAVCKRYPSDEWFIETGEPPVKPWYTIQDMAYQKGIIKDGYIGKCKYMFFDIWDVVSLYRKELEKNPFKLYGLE